MVKIIANPNIFFKDKEFPIYIVPNRTSVIDKIEDGKCEIHEALEIKCFYEGSSTLLIGNEAIIANAGDIVVINPYEFHATINYSEEKGKYHLIMVDLDFFPALPELGADLRSMFFFEKKVFANLISNSCDLRNLLTTVVTEYLEKKESYKLRIRGLMLEVLAILMRQGCVYQASASGGDCHQRRCACCYGIGKICGGNAEEDRPTCRCTFCKAERNNCHSRYP